MDDPRPFMQQALVLAEEAAKRNEVPIGAVLFHDGRILGQGSNDRERSGRTVAHAEIEALEDYSRRSGQWRLAPKTGLVTTVEPCIMCTGALLWARVDFVYFGCPDPKQAGLMALLPQIEAGRFDHCFASVVAGMEAEACAQLMKDFFQAKRNQRLIKPPSALSTSD